MGVHRICSKNVILALPLKASKAGDRCKGDRVSVSGQWGPAESLIVGSFGRMHSIKIAECTGLCLQTVLTTTD